ncbi:MAG TPA: zf-HC2 domain-containing protein [Vicinamibacterales bacterium]|nr:zf-HC2 domain-containing protein [Vicinamibacterales bacterium]
MADEIKTCRDLEEHFAPYVDGEEAPAARRAVESHLGACPPCGERAAAERDARDLVVQNRDRLRPAAPDDLRTRCAALSAASAFGAAPARQASRRTAAIRRWAPLSLAATLVLAVAGVFVFGLNDRVEALAASLAVDHVKCFKVGGNPAHAEPVVAERDWQHDQGWAIVVPQSAAAQQLALVDVRRCFSTDGRAAHMMYTWRGQPLSLYVLPENIGRDRVVERMGQEAVIWCANNRTYAVVAGGHPQDLAQVVDYMKAHAK